ncbi:39S ribosomal protein L12, mitochondrial-like protein [Jimgerdemannia flammicorona]|uniref:39S ribosomal protein L12, mitochondrial-like protein n=1 Tax=Jimgerdemannia flammicorona TaxID=994334 RepID=A0A433QDS1_9FUNG|nr:39S ribosomal protein L12, mitochondrial-like protein [Jimgerdemannia flammicorona]
MLLLYMIRVSHVHSQPIASSLGCFSLPPSPPHERYAGNVAQPSHGATSIPHSRSARHLLPVLTYLSSSHVASTSLLLSSFLYRQCSFYSTETDKLPTPGTVQTNPKITAIVEQIASLTLLQTADLVSLLKTRLNIADIAMPTMVQAAPAAPAVAAPVEEEKPAEKTEFKVRLEVVDAAAKAKVIREIKSIIPGINLVEAKKFVESVPKVIKENVPKEEAEKLKKTLEALGATVVLE